MALIQSNAISAADAISELVSVDTSNVQNQQVSFSYTQEITGMENGKEVTNSVLQAISEFSQAVLIQANKFPQIAAVKERYRGISKMESLNKKIDKSEKERSTLTRKIIELEEKEDDLKLLQKRHENRVLYLAEQFEQLSSGVDSLLKESDMSTQFRIQELENNQELRRQMSEYVQIHFDDIEKWSQSIRRNTDEQRDKLISERNRLPWE